MKVMGKRAGMIAGLRAYGLTGKMLRYSIKLKEE
jgi:hypothetical protein